MLNNVVLMGRLTADPELRHTPNDVAVTSFTLAVNRSYVKAGAERVTDFIDVVAWRSNAEFVSKYFHKGQLVAVQGSLQTRSYQDKEGNRRKAFEIVADAVHFAESKKDSQPTFSGDTNSVSTTNSESTNNLFEEKKEEPIAYANGDDDAFKQVPMDDDLPF